MRFKVGALTLKYAHASLVFISSFEVVSGSLQQSHFSSNRRAISSSMLFLKSSELTDSVCMYFLFIFVCVKPRKWFFWKADCSVLYSLWKEVWKEPLLSVSRLLCYVRRHRPKPTRCGRFDPPKRSLKSSWCLEWLCLMIVFLAFNLISLDTFMVNLSDLSKANPYP